MTFDSQTITADNYCEAAARTECNYAPVLERLNSFQNYGMLLKIRTDMERMIRLGKELDLLKKAVFYGKTDLVDIHLHSINVLDHKALDLMHTDPRAIRMLHSFMGLTTETGELGEQLYSYFYLGRPLDAVNWYEELGDVCWYLGIGLKAVSRRLLGCLRTNIAKLLRRYPEKFTETLANHRDLDAERRALEN